MISYWSIPSMRDSDEPQSHLISLITAPQGSVCVDKRVPKSPVLSLVYWSSVCTRRTRIYSPSNMSAGLTASAVVRRKSVSMFGIKWKFSIRFTVLRSIPALSATSCCDNPASKRYCFRRLATFFVLVSTVCSFRGVWFIEIVPSLE